MNIQRKSSNLWLKMQRQRYPLFCCLIRTFCITKHRIEIPWFMCLLFRLFICIGKSGNNLTTTSCYNCCTYVHAIPLEWKHFVHASHFRNWWKTYCIVKNEKWNMLLSISSDDRRGRMPPALTWCQTQKFILWKCVICFHIFFQFFNMLQD